MAMLRQDPLRLKKLLLAHIRSCSNWKCLTCRRLNVILQRRQAHLLLLPDELLSLVNSFLPPVAMACSAAACSKWSSVLHGAARMRADRYNVVCDWNLPAARVIWSLHNRECARPWLSKPAMAWSARHIDGRHPDDLDVLAAHEDGDTLVLIADHHEDAQFTNTETGAVSYHRTSRMCVVSASTGKECIDLEEPCLPQKIAISNDVIAATIGGCVQLWSLSSGRRTGRLTIYSSDIQISALALSGDVLICSGGRDVPEPSESHSLDIHCSYVHVWSVAERRQAVLGRHKGYVNSVAIHGSLAVSGSDDYGPPELDGWEDPDCLEDANGMVKVWRLSAAGAPAHLLASLPHTFRILQLSMDTRYVASCGDGEALLWSLHDFTCVRKFDGNIECVHLNCGVLATGGDAIIRLWSVDGGDCICELDHSTAVRREQPDDDEEEDYDVLAVAICQGGKLVTYAGPHDTKDHTYVSWRSARALS